MYFTHSYRAPVVEATVGRCEYGGAVFRGGGARAAFWSAVSPGEIGEQRGFTFCVIFANCRNQTVMLTKRIIACLDVDAGRVVKGVQFSELRDAGDPAELALTHGRAGADEVVLLDISATYENRSTLLDVVRRTARQLFIPFTVGGGIRSLDDAAAVFDAGADKVAVNSAALADPALIGRIAHRYGSQAVIVAIDALRVGNGNGLSFRSEGNGRPAHYRSRCGGMGQSKRSNAERARSCLPRLIAMECATASIAN